MMQRSCRSAQPSSALMEKTTGATLSPRQSNGRQPHAAMRSAFRGGLQAKCSTLPASSDGPGLKAPGWVRLA